MGATYNANLLPDHISPAFNPDNKHMLIQHDIRDAADKLVAPWDVPAILRPGALVLANVSMHMFKFKTNGRRDRKVRCCCCLFTDHLSKTVGHNISSTNYTLIKLSFSLLLHCHLHLLHRLLPLPCYHLRSLPPKPWKSLSMQMQHSPTFERGKLKLSNPRLFRVMPMTTQMK